MNPSIKRWLPAGMAAVVMLVSGLVHGIQTDRWVSSVPQRIRGAAERLQRVPAVIGDWESQELEVPARQLERAEAVGHLSRVYTNRLNGVQVGILIVCGRPGPIATHPPTVCFRGSGLNPVAPEVRFTVPAEEEESPLGDFWFTDFHKTAEGLTVWQRAFWTWHADNYCHAPDNPRFAFARNPYLYKLYVTRTMSDNRTRPENDPCIDFLKAFLPELNRSLAEL